MNLVLRKFCIGFTCLEERQGCVCVYWGAPVKDADFDDAEEEFFKKVRKILVLERWEKNLMAMMDVLIFSPEGALAWRSGGWSGRWGRGGASRNPENYQNYNIIIMSTMIMIIEGL